MDLGRLLFWNSNLRDGFYNHFTIAVSSGAGELEARREGRRVTTWDFCSVGIVGDCLDFKPKRLSLQSSGIQQQLKLCCHLDFYFKKHIKYKSFLGSPWRIHEDCVFSFVQKIRTHVLYGKHVVDDEYEGYHKRYLNFRAYSGASSHQQVCEGKCIGFGEAEDHDLEDLKKPLETLMVITSKCQRLLSIPSQVGTHMNPATVFRIKKQSSCASLFLACYDKVDEITRP
ncbi:hypothetical protein Bca4012_064859 [Brassica carinata]